MSPNPGRCCIHTWLWNLIHINGPFLAMEPPKLQRFLLKQQCQPSCKRPSLSHQDGHQAAAWIRFWETSCFPAAPLREKERETPRGGEAHTQRRALCSVRGRQGVSVSLPMGRCWWGKSSWLKPFGPRQTSLRAEKLVTIFPHVGRRGRPMAGHVRHSISQSLRAGDRRQQPTSPPVWCTLCPWFCSPNTRLLVSGRR